MRATGPIGCTSGEHISITLTVTQAATGARARKTWKGRCTGELQDWQVRARAPATQRGSRPEQAGSVPSPRREARLASPISGGGARARPQHALLMPGSGAPPPPRPRDNPVLGSALELRRSQIRTYERVMREHGDVVRLIVGPPGLRFDLYCVFHPDAVRAVLAGSREGYSKGKTASDTVPTNA